MKASEFFGKFRSGYLWGNLLAMVVVTVMIIVGVKYALDYYTRHGESLTVPSVKHKKVSEARRILEDLGLSTVVSDTGYVKTMLPDVVLEQSILPGEKVKEGRVIYLTVNALTTPTIALPDIIDNSSLREAMARLSAMGFKLAMPEFVPGEKDWVYGVTVDGKQKVAGDRISIEDAIVIQAGNGLRDSTDYINYIDPIYPELDDEIIEELEHLNIAPPKPAATPENTHE